MMNLKELKELIELVSERGFAEFEIERKGFRLRISRFHEQPRQGDLPPVILASPVATPLQLPPGGYSAEPQQTAAAGHSGEQSAEQDGRPQADFQLHQIKSPIVGTFYRSPSPNSEAFVKVGDRISPETVVCIIEAMKLMNEIHAEVAGVVVETYVENGQPVEYGQRLFGVKT
jgi:acetyl-CoA carboxylase biotin carboxyl carrier protein